jgi:hypothetical protein
MVVLSRKFEISRSKRNGVVEFEFLQKMSLENGTRRGVAQFLCGFVSK